MALVSLVGGGSATLSAQEVTLDFSTNTWGLPTSNNKSSASYTDTTTGYTVSFGSSNNGFKFNKEYVIMGKKGATLSLPAFTFDVEKIEVVGKTGASSSTKQNIYVGSTAVSTETTGVTGTNVYEIAADYQAAGNVYTLQVTSAHNSQITKILIYKKESAGDVSAPTFSVASGTSFEDNLHLTLSSETEGASIYYTTDGTTPSAESTLYTEAGIDITATTTVKAIAVKDGVSSSVASATYTKVTTYADLAALKAAAVSGGTYNVTLNNAVVTFVNGSNAYIQDATAGILYYSSGHGLTAGQVLNGTATVAYTVYNGLNEITSMTGATATDGGTVTATTLTAAELLANPAKYESMLVKVEGVSVTTAFTSSSRAGAVEKDGSTINLYNAVSGTTFADMIEGNTVNVTGYPGYYNTTFQLNVYEGGIVGDGQTTVVAAPVISPDSQTFSESFSATITCTTSGATIYYTLDGSDPATATDRLTYTEAVTIPAATTTLKAVAELDGTQSDVVTATYTYKEPVAPAEGTCTYVKVTDEADLVAGATYIIVNEDNKVTMGTTGNKSRVPVAVTITDGVISVDAANVATEAGESDKVYEFILGGESGAWTFQDAADGTYLTGGKSDLGTSTTATSSTNATIDINSIKNSTIKFGSYQLKYNATAKMFRTYSGSTGVVVQLYRKVGALKVSAAGYVTLYTNDAFVMPEGVQGGNVKATNSDYTALEISYDYTAGTTVPARTPLLLKAEEGTYYYTLLSQNTDSPAELGALDVLYGSVTATTTTGNRVDGAESYRYYKLSYDTNKENLGFYWGADNGAEFQSKAGLCYLAIPASNTQSQRRGFSLTEIENKATGINGAATEAAPAAAIYTLDGRRAASTKAKGIYIVGGKKVIVK